MVKMGTIAFKFKRYGRSCHLQIKDAADLERAAELSETHWVATGAPLNTMNCDNTFLRMVDFDDNGWIMCYEITEAICWLVGTLRDTSGVTVRSKTLRLDALDTDSEEGRQIGESVQKMLDRLGLSEVGEISLEQVRQIKAQVEAMPVSEAGVVLPEATEDVEIRQFIEDIVATVGGATHPSGKQGVGQDQLEKFLSDVAAHLDWHAQGQVRDGESKTDVMPLGRDTSSAYSVLSAVRDKIEQYFAQCEAMALDERFAQRMGWTDAELDGLDLDDPAVIVKILTKAPLVKPRSDGKLFFGDSINPHYAEPLEKLLKQVIQPLLGESPSAITTEHWQDVCSVFDAHEAWVTAKPSTAVESLGVDKLRSYLDDRFAGTLRSLIVDSTKTAFVLNNIRLTEKLILYQAYTIDLANNFVSFPHLYDPSRRALFEMGSMVMDGRRFNLAVKVENRAQHVEVAKTSNMCVLYIEVAPKPGGQSYEVAVPVTSGGRGNLCVGKRGVFQDHDGNECGARVVQVIENPINMGEALVSPFRKLGRLLTGKIESITAEAEKKLDAQASTVVTGLRQAGQSQPQPSAGKASGLMAGGLLMGGGVAVAAIGSAVAYITKTLGSLHWWQILIGLGAAVLAVIVPTAIVAFLKLRRRDLSAILEGSGWGINTRMNLTGKQARYFVQRPSYPKGAKGVRSGLWRFVLVIGVLVAILAGAGYLLMRGKVINKPEIELNSAESEMNQSNTSNQSH